MIDVFISHSSQDMALAERVVDLLRSALNLRADGIRCTSVEGYRLPVGADSDEQLREELLGARAFVGILRGTRSGRAGGGRVPRTRTIHGRRSCSTGTSCPPSMTRSLAAARFHSRRSVSGWKLMRAISTRWQC